MTVTGHNSAVSWAKESAYGTLATLTTRLPFISESFDGVPKHVINPAIRDGNLMGIDDDTHLAAVEWSGGIVFPLYDRGLEEWWRCLFGGYSFGAGTPNTHTFTPDGITVPSLSVGVGLGGDTSAYTKTLQGVVVTGASISWSADDDAPIQVEFQCVAEEGILASAAAIAGTEVSGAVPFDWAQTTVTVGTEPCVTAFSLDITTNMSGVYALNGTAKPKEPVRRGRFEVTGTVDLEFQDWDEADDLLDGTVKQFTVASAGATNSTTFTMNTHWVDGLEMVEGEDAITTSKSFRVVPTTAGDSDVSGISLAVLNSQATLS